MAAVRVRVRENVSRGAWLFLVMLSLLGWAWALSGGCSGDGAALQSVSRDFGWWPPCDLPPACDPDIGVPRTVWPDLAQ